jgi:hypothetical protein
LEVLEQSTTNKVEVDTEKNLPVQDSSDEEEIIANLGRVKVVDIDVTKLA